MASLSPYRGPEGEGRSSLNASTVIGEFSGSHQLMMHAQPRRQKALHAGTLVVLVSALVVLTAIITCLHLSKQRVRKHQGPGRRLAAGEDDEDQEKFLSELLEGCLETEEELNLLPTQPKEGEENEQDRFLSSVLLDCLDMQEESGCFIRQPPLPEKSEAVTRMVSSFYRIQKSLNDFPQSEGLSPLFPFPPVNRGPLSLHQWQLSPSLPPQNENLEPLDLSLPKQMHATSTTGVLMPGEVDQEPLDLSLPKQMHATSTTGVLMPGEVDQQPLAHVSTIEHSKQPTSAATKKRTKRSSTSSAPGARSKRKRQRTTEPQSPGLQQGAVKAASHGHLAAPHTTPQGGESASAESPVASTSSALDAGSSQPPASSVPSPPEEGSHAMSPSDDDLPSNSEAAPSFALPEPAPLMPPDTHLYYRLPVLQPGRIKGQFNVRRAFSPGRTGFPHVHLVKIHRLLAQPVITPSEAVLIMRATEEIVNNLFHHHTTSIEGKKPSFAAAKLARRYICLEAIFCAIQVVGPPMRADQWWRKLLQFIPTDYQITTPFAGRVTAADRLAVRISAALSFLKQGIRPSMHTTVFLKRDIFTCQDMEFGIRDKKWDPWREDDNANGPPQS
ncbi:hypothetical protein Emed_003321 [Eimeria media]